MKALTWLTRHRFSYLDMLFLFLGITLLNQGAVSVAGLTAILILLSLVSSIVENNVARRFGKSSS